MIDSSCSFESEITAEAVAAFARLSGDFNPLHTDEAYARTTEFGRPIAHGALLLGLVSRVLGMHIPGKRSLILSMRIAFPKPLFFPAKVRVDGKLKHFDEERGLGAVTVQVIDQAKLWCVAEAEVAFSLHAASSGQDRPAATATAGGPRPALSGRRARLLVTGGTGGLGAAILPALAERFELCCVSRSDRAAAAGVVYERADLERPEELDALLKRLSPSDFFGVLHMSAPPMARGFVSDDLELARRHWLHAVAAPLRLASWARGAGSAVKRMIFMGSTAGARLQPQAGAYSLGKAALEDVARLLVGDLAAQGATVNVVCPSLVPVGMNEGLSERSRKALAGRVPTGRLVAPADVAATVLFLLSEGSGQINGAAIPVDGGLGE